MKVMKVLVAVALLAALVGCGRSDREQSFYDLGYDYADSVIDLYPTRDALIDSCAAYTVNRGIAPKSDEANALRDGCWDRWDEEEE